MTPLIPRSACGLVLALAALPAAAADPAPVRWRTDYNAARQEARDKGLPLLLSIGSEECFYCMKQDATTFRDPALAATLNGQFVAVKIDGNREVALTQALRIQSYPTTVLAAPDGKVLAFLQGYHSADQLREHTRKALAAVATPDWITRDLQDAYKALGGSDYPRAVALLKGVLADPADSPGRKKAEQVLAEVERSAADRLARARQLDARGDSDAAAALFADLARDFAGTQAAADAAARLAGGKADRSRVARARELLAAAREEFRSRRYADCLDRCESVSAQFADLPEGRDALSLAEQIKADPDRLAVACEQLNERTAALYLTLAETWVKKGQPKEAQACLEKVLRLSPGGRSAEMAQARLTSLRKGETPAVPAAFEK